MIADFRATWKKELYIALPSETKFEHGLGGKQTIFKGGLNQRHIEEPLSTNLSVNNNFRILPTKILNITMKSFDKTSNSSDHKIGLIQNSGFIS